MKKAYIKCIFNLIFSGELYGDFSGYLDIDSNLLLQFPIHNKIADIFKSLYMKDFKDIIIYGGKYESKNWWYDFWDADDIMDIVNGDFSFNMSVTIEKDDTPQTCRCSVKIRNYNIFEMVIIDDEDNEYFVIKDGRIND